MTFDPDRLLETLGRHGVRVVPAGTRGFDDLVRDSIRIDIAGTAMQVASLADVIRSKEAADREKDRAALPRLRRLLSDMGEALPHGLRPQRSNPWARTPAAPVDISARRGDTDRWGEDVAARSPRRHP